MKKVTILALVLLGMLASSAAFAQTAYTAELKNGSYTAANVYKFDIYIYGTGAPLDMYLFQVGLTFPKKVRNFGTLTTAYVASTSELPASYVPGNPNVATFIPVTATTGVVGGVAIGDTVCMFKIAGKSVSGSSTPIATTGVRLGSFTITTSAASFLAPPSGIMTWNFNGTTPFYGTKVQAIVGGLPVDVTVQGGHSNLLTTQLPVELSSFTASAKGRDARIDWVTATEIHSSKFEVERSVVKANAAREWVKIASVTAAGQSNSEKNYSFTDKKLNTGKYVYRLKMIDADGSVEFSKNEVEVNIDRPSEYALSQNYPNPFNPSTKIDYQLKEDGRVVLEVFAVNGEKVGTLINEEQAAGYYTFPMEAAKINSGLASGMYIYRLSAGVSGADHKFVSVKKMIVLK